VERWKGGKVERWKGGKVEKLKSYKDLEVWKVAMDLVTEVYQLTHSFPSYELYGLSSQMRRCAVSIPSNIAEGAGRRNTKEFIQFLYVSNGSLSELETQIEIAFRLNYMKDIDILIDRIKHIRIMLLNLIQALKKKLSNT
jgi:four helix bundle protein